MTKFNSSPPIVVCGLHRSGTSFVGELMRYAGACVIHEPLNERFGMDNVPIAYAYVEKDTDSMAELLDAAVFLARPWNRDVDHLQLSGIYRRIYAFTGGRSGLRWGGLRLRRAIGVPHPRICLKDPFMTLAIPYLVQKHGLNVVCMVRHPAAIHFSTAKQRWRFDVNNLLKQPDLMARYGTIIPDAHWKLARAHAAASIAVLWKLMIHINQSMLQDQRLLVLTHESLCFEPLKTARRICNHFCVPFSKQSEGFMKSHSQGLRVEAKDGMVHDFQRDSRAIPDAWRGNLPIEDEQMIMEVAGKEIQLIYGHV